MRVGAVSAACGYPMSLAIVAHPHVYRKRMDSHRGEKTWQRGVIQAADPADAINGSEYDSDVTRAQLFPEAALIELFVLRKS
jgi:hypothetical protein